MDERTSKAYSQLELVGNKLCHDENIAKAHPALESISFLNVGQVHEDACVIMYVKLFGKTTKAAWTVFDKIVRERIRHHQDRKRSLQPAPVFEWVDPSQAFNTPDLLDLSNSLETFSRFLIVYYRDGLFPITRKTIQQSCEARQALPDGLRAKPITSYATVLCDQAKSVFTLSPFRDRDTMMTSLKHTVASLETDQKLLKTDERLLWFRVLNTDTIDEDGCAVLAAQASSMLSKPDWHAVIEAFKQRLQIHHDRTSTQQPPLTSYVHTPNSDFGVPNDRLNKLIVIHFKQIQHDKPATIYGRALLKAAEAATSVIPAPGTWLDSQTSHE